MNRVLPSTDVDYFAEMEESTLPLLLIFSEESGGSCFEKRIKIETPEPLINNGDPRLDSLSSWQEYYGREVSHEC